ncbi:MAG: ribosome maturation factor RimM [Saccharofermentanales bacterium]
MKDLLIIGRITGTHGVRGEVNVFPLTDDPKRFSVLKDCFMLADIDSKRTSVIVKGVKYFKNKVILQIDGIDNCEDALKTKGKYLAVTRDQAIKLEPGSYFICDLIGSVVIDDVEGELGILDDVLQTGASDIYIVKRPGLKDLLIPAIKEIIKEINLESREIHVHLLDGLLDL